MHLIGFSRGMWRPSDLGFVNEYGPRHGKEEEEEEKNYLFIINRYKRTR